MVYYQFEGGAIFVLAVLHHARSDITIESRLG